MIELKNGCELAFSFPEVHQLAKVSVNFQRTLRIPDNDAVYALPPGLGAFPIAHVDDYSSRVPQSWVTHGGVMLPMYQAEAMWLYFLPQPAPGRGSEYPFAIKVSTGKIDAITGAELTKGLKRDQQNYVVVPGQPWLDGYCVKKGVIRQFVAMPLGQGYTAEEQITHKAEHGGLQIVVYPMKAHVYETRYPYIAPAPSGWAAASWGAPAPASQPQPACGSSFIGQPSSSNWSPPQLAKAPQQAEMGLAPGGRMKQEIFRDHFDINDWDLNNYSRCFVHLANSQLWQNITGSLPPHLPPTAQEYAQHGLPWFDYYDDRLQALPGSSTLAHLTSVQSLSQYKGTPMPNAPLKPAPIVHLKPGQVREGDF